MQWDGRDVALHGDLARSIDGTMIISVNDHPAMREAFAGLHMQSVPISYTVGGGAGVDRMELIIGNWSGGWPDPRPLTSQIPIF